MLQIDASPNGLGAVLLQIQPTCKMCLVSAASRSLSDTKKRYATIEQDALGILLAYKKVLYNQNNSNSSSKS